MGVCVRQESSLQRLSSSEAPLLWNATGAGPANGPGSLGASAHAGARAAAASSGPGAGPGPGGGPQDWRQLAAAAGVQHFALLPLRAGGALAGALQLCVGGRAGAGAGGGTGPGGPVPVPNWLPAHVPDLLLLAPVVSVACGLCTAPAIGGVGLAASAGPAPAANHAAAAAGAGAGASGAGAALPARWAALGGAVSAQQVAVDTVAALQRCGCVAAVAAVLVAGMQELAVRLTCMPFTALPLLLHRTGATAAIFTDPAGGAGAGAGAAPGATGGGGGGAGAPVAGPAPASAAEAGAGAASSLIPTCGSAPDALGKEGPGAVRPEGETRAISGPDPSPARVLSSQAAPPGLVDGSEHALARAPSGVRAHIAHLHHTLVQQLLLGVEGSRYARAYGGALIANASEYMLDETNRGRDTALLHRSGAGDVGSIVVALGPALGPGPGPGPGPQGPSGAPAPAMSSPNGSGLGVGSGPVLGAYLVSREPLPEALLEAALGGAAEVIRLAQWPLQALLTASASPLAAAAAAASAAAAAAASPGGGPPPAGESASQFAALSCASDLAEEWACLHDTHLHPTAVALSTTATPRAFTRSATREVAAAAAGGGGGGTGSLPYATSAVSLPGVTAASGVDEADRSALLSPRRGLSFALAGAAAPPPRSHLGLLVSSIRSSLQQVLAQRSALEAEVLQDDLAGVELLRQIGQGGQGVVFCGTLHGLEVAVKVVGTEEGADEVYDIDDEGAAVKLRRVLKRDATELAVTTAISHPMCVQVYSCFVDVLVVEYAGQPDRYRLLARARGGAGGGAGGGGAGGGGAGGAGGGGGVQGPSNMVLCMEYCDAGSLKQAVKKGCFRGEAAQPDMQKIYTTLMEIALALRHMHALRLAHCDLKPSNILLKSSLRDPRGWVSKLSDFGCCRLMSEPSPGSGQRPSFNLEFAVGTPAFMAPEMFCKGHPLDSAVDIYSFGILMWEVFTGGAVYDGVPPDKLPYHVVKRGLRPAFPAETPSAYRSLAQACWASDPRSRPTAAALVTVLQRLLVACGPPQGQGQGQ
ncbi:hypothetical protein HYH03_018926 [Edaphochlamys debaryana]|uniref:Protein kinase domain-containing protein n=1 Tax=Edaphochlamys debaryana TaxID=47281 RepID=A0A835XKU9_9CHLO|nr:hypothetical protein HYH03_018926 [Edaphochlamys debaryana]|eukprot:KAG2482119.1 hypothetical protein HYH03_018926 [Edaphochlamys debaryana]